MISADRNFMHRALRLARRGYGTTSPNPMVGAVLVKRGRIIGRGWHRHAGGPHAEIEALRDAQRHDHSPRGATLYVTLEPCCTYGRTPPCTEAILAAGIKRVVIGTPDPNPNHSGRGLLILKRAGIEVVPDLLREDCTKLNASFNHWIVHRTPFVTVKAAMTLDGKIATAGGESKWITGEAARRYGMNLRQGSDAILVGINTILADDPSLTVRPVEKIKLPKSNALPPRLRRFVLDAMARTPLSATVVTDAHRALTMVVVSDRAPKRRVAALAKCVNVLVAPAWKSALRSPRRAINLRWLLRELGASNVTSLLVEGGGEVNASFLLGGFAQRVAFFYAPKTLGGRDARKGVAGNGVGRMAEVIPLRDIKWRALGPDLLLTARVTNPGD